MSERYIPATVSSSIAPVRPSASPTQFYINDLRSPASRKTMLYALNAFAKHLSSTSHITIPWEQVGYYDITMFLNHLEDKGLKSARLNTYLSALKKSSEHAWRMGFMSPETYHHIKTIKARSVRTLTKKRPLKDDEVAKLFILPDGGEIDDKVVRDNAIIAILIGVGLRCSELMNMQMSHIVEEQGQVALRFSGKGGHERQVALTPDVLAHLDRWLAIREGISTPSSHIFLSMRKGNKHVGQPIQARSTVFRIVRDRCLSLSGNTRVGVHDLRRTTATILFASGVEIEIIQDILGHSNINTTKRYIEVAQEVYVSALSCIKLPV